MVDLEAPAEPSQRIAPRNLHFDLGDDLRRHWHGGDPFRTAFFDALSLTFPEGESSFVDSVRWARTSLGEHDETQAAEIRGFIGQELIHTREHEKYNRIACEWRGVDATDADRRLKEEIDRVRAMDGRTWIAATAAAEHLTALFSEAVLEDRAFLGAGVPPSMVRFWQWHCLEELEHRSVAHELCGRLRVGYFRRAAAMIIASTILVRAVLRNLKLLLAPLDPVERRASWKSGRRWLTGRGRFLRRIGPAYLAYFLPGFDPKRRRLPDLTPFRDRYQRQLEAA